MDVEIKQTKEQKNKPEIIAKTTKQASIKPSGKHGNIVPKVVIKSAKNNKNIITIIALDEQSNEKGNEFTVTEKEYERSFSNDKKFKFKKKAI